MISIPAGRAEKFLNNGIFSIFPYLIPDPFTSNQVEKSTKQLPTLLLQIIIVIGVGGSMVSATQLMPFFFLSPIHLSRNTSLRFHYSQVSNS